LQLSLIAAERIPAVKSTAGFLNNVTWRRGTRGDIPRVKAGWEIAVIAAAFAIFTPQKRQGIAAGALTATWALAAQRRLACRQAASAKATT
jgi:hypothetical protein